MDLQNEIPKYRKKSKSSQSNSKKRSDHKHQYEKVILYNKWFGFHWGERCSVCGRFDNSYNGFDALKKGLWLDDPDCISKLFPNIDVYERKENGEYVKIDI